MKFKAAYLERLNENLSISKLVEVPDLKPGQVLIKLAYSGVCHSQLMEARGKRGPDNYLPHMLGHEGSGVVVNIGSGVSKFSEGDRVVLGWIKCSGLDAGGSVYKCEEKNINAGGVTTFSEYSVVSENRLIKMPDDLPMDVGVLFGCAIPTGAGIILNELDAPEKSSFLFLGLGGIGLCALAASASKKPSIVIAADISEEKLKLAESFGATHCINPSKQDLLAEVMEITNGIGVDFAVEAAGLVSTIETAYACIRKNGGLCCFASHPEFGEKISIDPFDLISGKQIRGTWGGGSNPERDMKIFSQMYREGSLPLDKLLSKPMKLEQINEALQALESHKVTRALIELDSSIK